MPPPFRPSKEYIYAGGKLVATEEVGPTAVSDGASCALQQVANPMIAGHTYNVEIRMSNTVPTTMWDTASYALASRGSIDWGVHSVPLTQPVLGSGPAVFNFTVTAPSTPGTYNFQWQMAHSGTLFGSPSDSVAVVVNSPIAVNITQPTNSFSANAPTNITLSATASDSDAAISKVDFYRGTTLIGTTTTAQSGTYSLAWNNVSAGSYTLTAKATDSAGTSNTSVPVNITVNSPPTALLIMPDNGPLFTAPANLALNAYANDFDGTVSKVDFYQDANLIGTINGPITPGTPYTFQWNNVSAGTYTLTAKSTDNSGAVTTSNTVKIKVNVMPPLIYDDFNDNTRDVAKWVILNAPSVVNVAEQNQQLEISPTIDTAAYSGYSMASAIDLTNAEASVELVQPTAPVGSAQTLFGIWGSGAWGYGGFLICADGSNIYFQLNVNGVITQNHLIPYDPTQHQYLRIRHDVVTDNIVWETSADEITWTSQFTIARPFPITAMWPVLYAGKWGNEVNQPGTAIFDNFRVDWVNQVNVALASNGATASASSYFNGFAPSGVINGDRKGLGLGQNGYWSSSGPGFPQSLEVSFSGTKTLTEIDVFTVQDNYSNPSEPTSALTFSQYGMTSYEVQYWNGSEYVDVPGGNVTNNNLVWRRFTFAPLTTNKIRVLSYSSPDSWSRATEIEAWGD
ncbi:MAG: Ig-like domain-containing protein [Pyrinomonadaceae bacterium]